MNRLDDELRLALQREQPPPDFAERVLSRLHTQPTAHVLPHRQRRHFSALATLAAAALVLIALVAGWWWNRQHGNNHLIDEPSATKKIPVAPQPESRKTDEERHATAEAAPPSRRNTPHPVIEKHRVFEMVTAETAANQVTFISWLEGDAAKHIERVQLLLRSFKNADASEHESAIDVSYEKKFARSLISSNVLLRREAQTESQAQIEKLLSDVEPFLLDIAHLPSVASPDEVRAIKERLQKKEIMLELQLYSTRTLSGTF